MTTPDSARAHGDDPVLAAGLAELAGEGVNLSDPVSDAPVDPAPAGAPAALPAPETPAPPADTPADPSGDPAPSATPPGDTPDAADTPADPLAGTEPFTYAVDGETRTMPHAFRVPGEGILIEEAGVPYFQLMASRAETLERTNRELYERTQQFERLSQWTTTDATGQSKVLTGREAIEASRVAAAQSQAVLEKLAQAIEDPATFGRLVSVNQQGQIVADPVALSHLVTEARLEALTREQAIRSQFATLATQPVAPPQVDVQASAPVILQNVVTQLKADALTAEDRTFLQGMLPKFVRPATPADVQSDPKLSVGAPVLDAAFGSLVQQQNSLRAGQTAVAKTADKAAAFNAGQKAGTKQGQPAPAPAKSTPQPSAANDPPARKNKAAAWDEPLHQAMAELGIPA